MYWFALKGKEAIDSINEYYKEQITKARESGYAKGLEEGKKGSNSKIATKPSSKKRLLNNKE
jgi:flagellar biosynthesis/type III secretory pathway protein FliH